jgi:ADP-heptose:LPS heptosyltransferase
MSERGSQMARFLDRVVGIPLVFTLSLFFRPRVRTSNWIAEKSIQRIAIFVSAAIGDTVLASALFSDLRRHFPDCRLVLVHGPSNRALRALLPHVETVELAIKNPFKAFFQIRRMKGVDVWLDTGQWPRMNALLSFVARILGKAAFTVGFKTTGQYRHYLYDKSLRHRPDVHELENFRALLAPLNCPALSFPKIEVSMEEVSPQVRTHLQTPFVVVHMFAGGSKPFLKEPDEDQWVNWIDQITAQEVDVIFTGIGSDTPKARQVEAKCQRGKRIFVLTGALSLRETAQILKAARYVLSVNTGILHLAAAVGVKTLGIHGPTSVLRWGPVGPMGYSDLSVRALQSPRKCSPCLNLGFDYGCPRNDCMKDMTWSSIQQNLRGW